MSFVKDAFAELEHVVWPTKRETQAYYKIVVIFIIVFTLFLFVIGYLFGEAIFGIKDIVSGGNGTNVELEGSPINIDLGDIEAQGGDVSVTIGEDGTATVIDPEASETETTETDSTPSE